MAERRIVVPVVAGSSPVIHPIILKPHLEGFQSAVFLFKRISFRLALLSLWIQKKQLWLLTMKA